MKTVCTLEGTELGVSKIPAAARKLATPSAWLMFLPSSLSCNARRSRYGSFYCRWAAFTAYVTMNMSVFH